MTRPPGPAALNRNKMKIFFPPSPPIISELLRKATATHDSGDFNNAVEYLKQAYREISKTTIGYPVQTFLRLPLYLQKAGRDQEAWGEFNKLLVNGHPNQMNDPCLIPMVHSNIYDKMRLFLQRKDDFQQAIIYCVLSFLLWMLGLHLQKRRSLLKRCSTKDSIKKQIHRLLKKSGKESSCEQLIDFISTQIQRLPNIDPHTVKGTIGLILANSQNGQPTPQTLKIEQ